MGQEPASRVDRVHLSIAADLLQSNAFLGAERGRLRFVGAPDVGELSVGLKNTGAGGYQVRLYPGPWDVAFDNSS